MTVSTLQPAGRDALALLGEERRRRENLLARGAGDHPFCRSLTLAADQFLVRRGPALRTVIAGHSDIEVVGEATDGREAVDMAEKHHPDIVLMDTQLPVVSGVEATQLIKRRNSGARVVLLTLGADDELILNMLRAGASGCLLKDADTAEMMLAIRTAYRGGSYLSPQIADRATRRRVLPSVP